MWPRSWNVQARVRERGEQRVERTRNMYHMLLTLDVLKLSGWLNAYASCPTKRRGHAMLAACGLGGASVWASGSARSGRGRGS